MKQRRQELALIPGPGMPAVTPRLRTILRSTVSAAVLLLLAGPAIAQQLPSGASVSAGSASISQPNGTTLNINQSTSLAIINWQSFSVGAGGTVNFNQPGTSSATLNRVTGSASSGIAGTINAPGTVLLVNPNGIAITRSGTINTGSFAASTLDIKDSDFLAGNYKFGGTGGSAAVVNNGRINVSDGGFAALLGGQVANNGVISARLGKVGLGAGEAAALDLSGDGFLSVTVPSSELGKLVKADRALVSNKGRIVADGGVVYLSAATAQNILRNAVNIPGSVRANTVGSHNGRIVINGGAGGSVKITGRLVANGRNGEKAGAVKVSGAQVELAGKVSASGATGGAISATATDRLTVSGKVEATASAGKGGTIDFTAANVTVVGALIDASGASGGGAIQIGGGIQGAGALAHALNVSIDSVSVVRADALDSGNGGTIAVWSDGGTSATGTFSARGGANGGDGGFIETSGPVLSINGIKVDTSAAYGATGNWLLDPIDLTVDETAANTISTNLGSNNVTLLTTSNSASGTGNPSSGLGDININANISWTSANTLTITAYHAINVNATINAGSNGKVVMTSGFDPTYTNLALINYSSTGNLTFGTSGGPTGRLTINGAAYSLVFNGGDIYGASASGNVAMAQDVTLPNNFGYFLGTFTGTFTGLGNQLNVGYNNNFINTIAAGATVRDLRLNAQASYYYVSGGLPNVIWGNPRSSLAQTSAGTVANVYLTGTFTNEAALIGSVTGGLVTNVYVSGYLANNQAAIAGSMSNATLRNAYSVTGNGVMLGSVSNSTVTNVFTNAIGGLASSATNTTFTNAYYDLSTRGSASSFGTGLTTFQLQNGLPTGFDSGTWAISTGTTYPYLRSAFSSAPQIVSGTGYSNTGGGVWQNTIVNLEIDTYSYFQASRTANNGYYYFQLPTAEIQSSGSTVVTYIISGNFSDYYAAATFALNATGSVRNMGLLNDSIGVVTTATTFSDPRVGSDLADALTAALTQLRPNTYQNYYLQYGTSLGLYTPSIQTRRILNAAGSFNVDPSNNTYSAITAADDLTLNMGFGNVQGYTPMIAAGRDIVLNTGLSSGWMRAGRDVKIQTGLTADGMTIYAGGDIAFNAAVNVSGLYLNAGDDILFNAAVTSTGTLQVNAADTISGSGAINTAGFWLQAGNYRQIGSLGAFSSTDFRLSAGTTFIRVLGGDGTAGNAYQIADVYGLQGVSTGLSLNYKLMNDIDASSTATWNSNAGFVAIGNGQTNATAFTGSFDGQGHVISGLTINRGGTDDIGLFGSNAGRIFDLGVANGRIAGRNNVGALAGNNLEGGVIERSFGAAPVSGSTYIGGLVGINTGAISQSFSTSSVTGGTRAGGLVGYNRHTATADGRITDSYANGNVSGSTIIGGFYGYNDSQVGIATSYSTGKVTATSVFGGFGGQLAATGAASVSSYWNTETSGQANAASAGGDAAVTGLTTTDMQAGLPAGFSTSTWGIVTGKSFPYLKWQFPNGTPQVVTGYAYKDNGLTLINGGLINAMVDGVTLGRGVTYSNGLYIVLIPEGSIHSSGSDVVAYYTSNPSQGLVNSASFAYQAIDSVTIPDIWGGYLSIPAPGGLVSTANPTIASAWSSVSAIGSTFVSGLTGARLGSTGNFTVDAAPDTSGGKIFITTSGASDIVVGSVNFANSNLITLNSSRDILVNGAISGSGNLSFVSARNIVFNGVVSGTNDVTLKAGGYATANAAFGVDAFTLDGTWSQIMSSMPAFSANSMTFTSGAFIRALGGDGTSVNPYQLTDVYGLQGILSPQLMNKNFVLANDIDASATAGWNSGAGFIPIGIGDQEMRPDAAAGVIVGTNNHGAVDTTRSFLGTFDGQGHTINNITISAGRNAVGVFGSNAGTITNVGIVGGTVAGNDYVGGLVGFNFGTITRSYTSGVTVSGRAGIGGLAGASGSGSLIEQSYANSRVGGTWAVAGFVGATAGSTFWSDCCGFYRNNWSGTVRDSYSMAAGGAGGFSGQGGGTNVIALEGGLDAYATTYGTTGLPAGFNPSIWGIIPGYSYPYLLWQFPAGTTPQAITGQVYGGPSGGALANVPLSAVVNGASIGNGFADGYGFYQILLPQGTVGAGSALLIYTTSLGTGGGAAIQSASGSARNNNIYAGGYVQWTTSGSSYTSAGYNAELASAIGGNSAAQTFVNGLTGLAITSTASGTYTIGSALSATGGIILNANGVLINGAISAGTDLTINASGITVAAAINADGAVRLNALNNTDITINGVVVSGGVLALTGRDMTITGALTAAGPVSLSGSVINSAAAITSNSTVSITGSAVTLGPLYWTNGALTVTATGAVNLNGVLSGAGPGAGATITGTAITANSTIDWQAGLMRLQATNGDVVLNAALNGWGPGAALTISGQSVTMRSASWQNGALSIAASAGAVNVTGSLSGGGSAAGANITGRSVSISGSLQYGAAGLNLGASAGDVAVTGGVVGNGGGGISGVNITLGGLSWANGDMGTGATNSLRINGHVDGMGSAWYVYGGTGTTTVTGAVGVQTFNLISGNWSQNAANLAPFYAINFNLSGGTTFTRFSGGNGSGGNPYNIVDIYGLQGLVTTPGLFDQNFVLGADIQAGITSGWNGGAGFIPIGSAGQQFSGTFNGQNHVINGLTINRSNMDNVGLFGVINGGSAQVANLNLTNVTVYGNNNVGGLAGQIGASVSNVVVTGNITALGNNVGGLAGNAFAGGFNMTGFSGNVSAGTPSFIDLGGGVYQGIVDGGTGGSNVGGLVGVTTVSVANSYAQGAVTSQGRNSANIGGLIGWLQSTSTNLSSNASVTNSVSSATVIAYGNGLPSLGGSSGGWFVGGLVGQNGNLGGDFNYFVNSRRQIGGNITSSFATGSVTAAGMSLGGLVGYNAGQISDSGASGFVARVGSSSLPTNAAALYGVGGLVGYNGGGIYRSSATGSYVSNDCSNCGTFTGGLVGQHGAPGINEIVLNWETATIVDSYATNSVWGSGPTGGLIGALQNSAILTRNYARGDVHGPGGSTGGLIGWVVNNNRGSENLSNYFNTGTTGLSNAIGAAVSGGNGGVFYGLSDSASRTQSSYAGFDFTSTWMMSASGYPALRSQTVIIVGNNTSATYGSGTPSLSYTAYGQLGFQSVSGVNMSASGTRIIGSGGSVSNSGNVTFVYLPGSIAITPRAIVVQGGDLSRVYGDSNPINAYSTNVTGAGLASGDVIGAVDVSNGPGAANNTRYGGADADAGYSYAYTTSNAFFTRGSALNYTITYANGSIAVTPRPVTVQLVGSATKTYDGTTGGAVVTAANFRVANVFPGLPDYTALSSSTGTAGTYASANAGTGINVSVSGISITSSNAALANNYVLASTTATGAIGTITPKTLSGTVDLSNVDKTYDGTTVSGGSSTQISGAAYGFLNGDGATLTALAGLYDSANAGARTVSGFTGMTLNNGNYAVGSLIVTGTGTISPKNLAGTAVINGIDKTYDGNTAAGGGSQLLSGAAYGLIGSDTLTLSALTGVYDSANAGTRTISSLTGLAIDNGNYRIGSLVATGAGTITPKDLSGTAIITGIDKTYDGTTAAGTGSMLLSGAAFGLVGSDTTTLSALTGLYDSANAGARTVSGLTGLSVGNGNYRIGSLVVTGAGTITPASITVTATGGTSVYGSSPSNPGFTAVGLQNGETVAVLGGLSNDFGIDRLSDAGDHTLSVIGTLTNGNYTVTNSIAGTWTVTRAPIVVTATGGTSVYGSSPTNPGFTATGLQNGQDVSVLTGLSNDFSVTNLSDVDSYTLRVTGTLTARNYMIVNDATDRVAGTWTVTKAPVVVTATGGTSVYGSSPTNPGFTATGLQNGQDVSVLTGLSNNFGIDNMTDAGDHPVNVVGTLTARNYAIVNNATDRVAGTWTVTPAPIVVTATGGTSVYGSSPINPGFTATGLQNGQDESFLTGLVNGFGIDRFSNAGDHTLDVTGTLTNGNYSVTNRVTGTWTVTRAALTVTATDQSKTYGDTHIFAGTEFSSLGLQNGESIGTVTLTSAGQTATAGVAGGPYAIAPSEASGGTFNIANYNVTYVNGGLTVTPAGIVVGALGGTSVYGTSPANPGLAATGLRNGEGVSVLTGLSNSFGIGNLTNTGNYTLNVAGVLTNPNYVVTGTTTANWIVTPAQLMYVANPAQRYFGDVNPPFSGTVTGFLNGDTLANATLGTLLFSTPATRETVLGTYAIDGFGLTASNYVFVQAPGNANALTISTPPTVPGSQFTPPGVAGTPNGGLNVSFQTTGATPTVTPISFTPRVASNNNGDVSPASLPANAGLGGNNAQTYQPISIFDANQYSQFQVPPYAAQAGQAALFTMIARAAVPDQAANFLIDTFWNGTGADLNGTGGNNPLAGKVVFSNGAGQEVTPAAGNGFAIEPGKTNFGEMLKSGPVMIGGAPGQWVLATGLSPDGKSVLANDPVSGKVVALTFDPANGAIGPVAGFYDAKSKGIVSLADSSGAVPAGANPQGIAGFTPATFFAIKVQ